MPGVVYVIHISSYREVELQVVDPSGKPASQVPLAILAEVEGRTRTIWRGLSAGPGGTVKASFLLGGVQRLGEVKLFAACHIPAGTGEKVPLPPDPTGRERVRLTLPPTGSILVEVQDGSGRPLDLEGLVTIEEARPGKEPGVRERWLQDAGPAVSLERGRALFPRVALGRTWTIRLGPADAMSFTPVHSSPLEGPREPGRVVRLSLTVKRTPRVTGRIVDSRGRPRVGIPLLGHLEMRIGTIAASLAGQMTLTDEDGRFTFAMDTTHVWERSSPAISWKLTWWLASDGRGRPGGPTAEPPLPDPLLPGVNDLGDILLADPAPEPLLAAGVVRDSRGKPVVGIEVVARSLADGRGKDSLDTKTLVGRTDREGRFEIFGILPEPVEVSARSWSLKIEKREITPGTRDLELVLLPAPELGGVLLVDPELPLDPLQVVLRDRHGRERGVSPTRKRSAWLEKESPGLVWNRRGGFVFKGVEPGRYDLSVRVGLRRIAGLGDVVVPRFGAARDPRLQGIDLRGHLRRQLLRVRDRQGQAIDNCTVLDLEDEEKPVRIYRGTAKGKEYHELLLLPECTRLAVGAPGWRPVRLTTAVAPLEVRLERGARVRIELKVPGRLRRRKLVYLEIRPAAADMTPAAKALLATGVGEPILAAPAGKVTRKEVALPGPGRYRARWIVKNGKRRLLLPCDEPPFFEVSGEKDPIFNFTLSEKEGDAVLTR